MTDRLVARLADDLRHDGKPALATAVAWHHEGERAWRECGVPTLMMELVGHRDPLQAARVACACVRLLALDGDALAAVTRTERWTRGEIEWDAARAAAHACELGPSADPVAMAIQLAVEDVACLASRDPLFVAAVSVNVVSGATHALARSIHQARGGGFFFDTYECAWQPTKSGAAEARRDACRLVCDAIRRHVPTFSLIKESP